MVSTIKKDLNSVTDQGQAYVFIRTGDSWTEAQILNMIGTDGYEFFGRSVAVSDDGSVIAIGAMNKVGGAGIGNGVVYLYGETGTGSSTWLLDQAFTDFEGSAGDCFGFSVALSGDGLTLAVGSPKKDVGANVNQGKVFVFSKDGADWVEDAVLAASDGTAGTTTYGSFGTSVAWAESGGTWTPSGAIVATFGGLGASNSNFGNSLSISDDGSTLAVGAPGFTPSTGLETSGAACVYVAGATAGTWAEKQALTAFDRQTLDNFGYCVSLTDDGSLLYVGAYTDSTTAASDYKGSVYIFD